MRRLQLSLKYLFGATAVIACFFAVLLASSELVWHAVRSVTLMVYIVVALLAALLEGRGRAMSVAFLKCGWTYLVFTYVICSFEESVQTLVTSWLTRRLWEAIRVENLSFNPATSVMGGSSPSYFPEWSLFYDISVLLTANTIGLMAAAITGAIRKPNVT